MTLSPPAIPRMPDLQVTPYIGGKYAALLTEARARMPENEALKLELYAQFGLADRNRYNLEVFLSIAELVGHHWRLLTEMAGAEQDLERAYAAAQKSQHRRVVGQLVAAYNRIDRIERERERTLHELQQVWEKSRYPRGQSVGGRDFVDVNDDTKDYWAQRRPDLRYLTAPEESIGLKEWQKSLREVMEAYAKQHNVPVRGLAEARLEE
jgi:hypothetical protein